MRLLLNWLLSAVSLLIVSRFMPGFYVRGFTAALIAALVIGLVNATLGADKLYQEEKFIAGLQARKVLPHVAEYQANEQWPNWLTEEERQHPGFALSQRKRKLVEKIFGWGKLDSVLRQVKLRGLRKVDWFFRLLATAANLVRLAKLIPAV